MASLTPRLDKIEAGQNLIINGNMDFAQRGSSVSVGSAVFQYQADRFYAYRDTANAITYAVVADAPTVLQSGFTTVNSLKITNGTGVTPTTSQIMMVGYRMEGYDFQLINAQTARYQFWVKSSVAGSYSVCFRNASINRSYLAPYTVLAANTWEKKAIDITLDQSGTWLLNNGIGLEVIYGLGVGPSLQTSTSSTWQGANYLGLSSNTNWAGTTGATFQITQVMMAQGSFSSTADLPFKRAGKTISQELQMCQRYYEKSYNVDVAPATVTGAGAEGITQAIAGGLRTGKVAFKVTKRVNPVVTAYSPVTGASGQLRNLTDGTDQAAGFTDMGHSGFANATNVGVGKEISWHWAVDVEL